MFGSNFEIFFYSILLHLCKYSSWVNKTSMRTGTILFCFALMPNEKNYYYILLFSCENFVALENPNWKMTIRTKKNIIKFQTLVWQPKSNRAKSDRKKRLKDKRIKYRIHFPYDKRKEIGTNRTEGLHNYIHKTKQLIVLKCAIWIMWYVTAAARFLFPIFYVSFSLIHSITFINRKFSSFCVCCHHICWSIECGV